MVRRLRPTSGELVVTLLVVSLFFERLNLTLYINHGFAIPDVTFVVAGLLVLVYAFVLAYRHRADLSHPSRVELTVVALFVVLGLAAVGAALAARSPTVPLGHPQHMGTNHVVLVSHLGQSVKTFVHFAYFALIALLLGRILTPALLRRALTTFFVLAVAASVLGVLQAIDQNALHTGASGSLHLLSRARGSGFVSPCSIYSEPAFLGYFALLGLLVGLRMRETWGTRWVWVGMAFCLVSILLAAAAGPLVTLAAVALYLAWRANRVWRPFWKELTALVVVAAAVLALLPAGKALTSRASSIVSGSDTSAKFRYAFDEASVRTWKLSPLTGVGMGNTRYYLPSLVDLSFDPNLTPSAARFQSVSSYLNALAESGVFGLLMLAVMLITLFWPFGTRRSGEAWLTEAAILVFIVASFFISIVSDPIFWFWLGLRLAELRGTEPEGAAEPATERELQPTLVA
jgi:O-antigen ligase